MGDSKDDGNSPAPNLSKYFDPRHITVFDEIYEGKNTMAKVCEIQDKELKEPRTDKEQNASFQVLAGAPDLSVDVSGQLDDNCQHVLSTETNKSSKDEEIGLLDVLPCSKEKDTVQLSNTATPQERPQSLIHKDTNVTPQSASKLSKYFNKPLSESPFENLQAQGVYSGRNTPQQSTEEGAAFVTLSPTSFLTPSVEDAFNDTILCNEIERQYDAWIPSEKTKKVLDLIASSPPGTYFPEKELLTMPGIAIKEEFGDPVKNLVKTYLGEEISIKRQTLTVSSVTQDGRGLRQLIAAGCYHAAINLTTQLLTVYGQGEGKAGHPSKHTAHSIQLWFTRIAILVKLRRFSLAEVECQHFGDLDSPDLYFEYYPELYGGRRGSMVPFAFRLLVAELPQFLGKHIQSLDGINRILRTVDQIIKNLNTGLNEIGEICDMTVNVREESVKLWISRRLRVLYSLTSCATSVKDFCLAESLIQNLIREDSQNKANLYSALGRLHLQLGDVTSAQEAFNCYLEYSPPPPKHNPIQGLLHSAYISIAQNAFRDAVDILQQAYKINPDNGLVINNLSVCLTYAGRIREAVEIVETAVYSQPETLLHEALVLNLATMYELESSHAHKNKLKLLTLISQYKGDAFNVAALKLQAQ